MKIIQLLFATLIGIFSTNAGGLTTAISNKAWGAFPGGNDAISLNNFESVVGKPVGIMSVFIHWGNNKDFPTELSQVVGQKGKTLLIFWEAMDYNKTINEQGPYSYDAINNGRWDSYIKNFAINARMYGAPVVIAPFSEMNGNWTQWGITVGNNTAQKHIKAWRRIYGIFKSNNATNVKFAWVVNCNAVPDTFANRFEKFYPGNAYVDYVGVDGFNFGNPWLSWESIFHDSLTRLQTYGKSTIIASMACDEGLPNQKAQWIVDMVPAMNNYPLVTGWVWFNENKWRVDSTPESLDAFRSILP